MKKNQLAKLKTDTIWTSDAIITLDINEQTAHMHSNTVAEEAMKLFDNLMTHKVDLADVDSDKNVEHCTVARCKARRHE